MFDATTAKIIIDWVKNHMGLMDSLMGSGEQPVPAPQDNAQIAFNYFVSQGLTPVQAAGIVGNLQGESGQRLNTSTRNPGDGRDGSDSIGIAQWNSARAQGLRDYAASKGTPYTDLTTQLEYLHSELKGPEKAAYEKLLAAQSPEEATRAMLAFERPKDWNVPGSHPQRSQYAARALATYGGGQPAAVNPVAASIMGQRPASAAAPATSASLASQLMGGAPQQASAQPVAAEQQISDPAMQMMPIQFAQRRSPDLSKLRALFGSPMSRG